MTRQVILDAAVERFSNQSYDDVGMRDIARDVGVDPALIVRYFGSKEELFTEVLSACKNGSDIFEGDRADWGRRMADEIVFGADNEDKSRGFMIILRSIASTKAMDVVRSASRERFYGPFEDWLGGEEPAVRTRLAAGLMMGMKVSKELSNGLQLSPEDSIRLRDRLAALLQGFVAA